MSLRSGKVNAVVIVIVAGLLGFAAISIFSGDRPVTATARFLDALAKGDVDQLVALGNTPGVDEKEMRDQWELATKVAGVYFKFYYKIKDESIVDEDHAVVIVELTPEVGSEVAYERRLEVPMTRVEGKWKVDVLALNRDIYPGLPR